MIRNLFIALLSILACCVMIAAITAATIGRGPQPRRLYGAGSFSTPWRVEVFVNQSCVRLSVARTTKISGFDRDTESKWSGRSGQLFGLEVPTLAVDWIEYQSGPFLGRNYFFIASAGTLLLVAGLLGLYPGIALYRGRLRHFIRCRRGLCVKCGYNLAGNVTGVCSECGSQFESKPAAET